MTKSNLKAYDGDIKIVVKGVEYWESPEKIKIGDTTLKELLDNHNELKIKVDNLVQSVNQKFFNVDNQFKKQEAKIQTNARDVKGVRAVVENEIAEKMKVGMEL